MWEARESDNQELKNLAQTTQSSIKKVHNKLDLHINNNQKKQEELKTELYHTLRQQQQEIGEANHTLRCV